MVMNRDVVVLSTDQFDKLVELLTPGYELAKAYMAESARRDAQYAATGMAESIAPTSDDASKVGDGQSPSAHVTTPPTDTFRPSAPAPEFNDPSKQGSG